MILKITIGRKAHGLLSLNMSVPNFTVLGDNNNNKLNLFLLNYNKQETS